MLKIRDGIDLKELEKYGFEVTGNFAKKVWYWNAIEGVSIEEDTWLVVEYRQLWLIEQGAKQSNERWFGNPQFDTVFDLIKDGLVEKVDEKL